MADEQLLVYEALMQAIRDGVEAALATVIETTGSIPRHSGSKMLVYADGRTVGTVGGGAMESQVIALAQQVITGGEARTQTYTLNNLADGDPGICGGSATIFVEPVVVPDTVLVIGGGHVGKALAELAKWAGFRVVLSDDRPEYCHAGYLPGLDQYVVCAPADIPEKIAIHSKMYICAVTRGLPVDEMLLPALLKTNASYIGLIGSKRRWALTVQALQERHAITDADIRRIHAPIGLEIQAETPAEIAVSILAEIIMIRRGGTGIPMRWYGMLEK
jgi:xanthine dehydrogenase accessory factor